MIQVSDFTVYALLDPGASLSFLTPYVSMNFYIIPKQLIEPISVSTPIGDSILADKVYCDCPVFINHKRTIVDLINSDMVDFNSHSWYGLASCLLCINKFQCSSSQVLVSNEPVIEKKSSLAVPMGCSVSYLKAKKIVSKRCAIT